MDENGAGPKSPHLSCWHLGEENDNHSYNTIDNISQPTDAIVEFKPKSSMLSSSVSAQDLRCMDLKKEKHIDSSPRGVLEAHIRSEGYRSDESDIQTRCLDLKPTSHWRRLITLCKIGSLKPKIYSRKITKESEKMGKIHDNFTESCNNKHTWKNFTFSELRDATNNFSPVNMVGKGGYAEVYKGCLQDGRLIAVKRLTRGTDDEQTADFLSELGIIAHVDHPNTAKLVGFGFEGGMHLVFELSLFGSLGSLLDGSKEMLDWNVRYKIALGTANGLLYLHENCQRRIIHRDIKADNILLTNDFVPQICDFGLALWLPEKCTHHNVSKFEGTFGYFAPEYFMNGIVDEKTDIYAFGILLLELITGRRALDHSQQSIVIWAKPFLDNINVTKILDSSLGDAYNAEELEHMALTASLCIDNSPILRPRMSQVVVLLRGDEYNANAVELTTKVKPEFFEEHLQKESSISKNTTHQDI